MMPTDGDFTRGTVGAQDAEAAIGEVLRAYQACHGPIPFAQQHRDEALFGFGEIAPFLRKDMTVLEIGAGTGLLAHVVARQVATLDALEPLGAGFQTFEGLLGFVQARSGPNLTALAGKIEEFGRTDHYDLIYSVNVFEHVDDWRQAVRAMHRAMRPGGQAIILIPNYDVPFEPHFGLPVLGAKEGTKRLFQKRIAAHESGRGANGLWDSLNFIRASELRRFCKGEGIDMTFDKGIMGRMLLRAAREPSFADRHRVLAPVLGRLDPGLVGKLFASLPLRLQPYVKSIFTKAA